MPYFIVVFLIFVFFISNVCKVNAYSKTIDPSPLKFEQARRLAINRLEYCTSNKECRQKNFNDILSGWWNLGTFSQNYKTSIKIMYSNSNPVNPSNCVIRILVYMLCLMCTRTPHSYTRAYSDTYTAY